MSSDTVYISSGAVTFKNSGTSLGGIQYTGANAIQFKDNAGGTSSAVTLSNVATPVSSTDVATKSYVDTVAQGLKVKASCLVATTESWTIAAGTSDSSAGTLILANGEGGFNSGTHTLTIDGVTIDTTAQGVGVRVLVKDAPSVNGTTSGEWNGIYTVGSLTGSTCTLTRATDMDIAAEVNGVFTLVTDGTTNVGAGFVVTEPDAHDSFTLGTTAIVFTQFSSAGGGGGFTTAGIGLASSGNTVSLDLSTLSTQLSTLASNGTERFGVHDGAQKYITFPDLRNEIYADVSSGATIAAGGALTIANTSITNAMLAGSIANDKLVSSTISGVSLGSNLFGLRLGETLVSSDATQAYGIRLSAAISVTDDGDKFFFAAYPTGGHIQSVRVATGIGTANEIAINTATLTDATTYQIAVVKDVGSGGDTLAFGGTGVWNTATTTFNNLNGSSANHGLTGTAEQHKVFVFTNGTTTIRDGSTVNLDLTANISASKLAIGTFTGASSVVAGAGPVGDVVLGFNAGYTAGENQPVIITVIAKLAHYYGSQTASVDVNYDTNVFEMGSNRNALTLKSSSVSSDMLAGSIANAKLQNSTISGVSLGSTLGAASFSGGLSAGYGGVTVSTNVTIPPYTNAVAFFAASAQVVQFVSYITVTSTNTFTVNANLTNGTYTVVVIDTGTTPHTIVYDTSGITSTAGVFAATGHGMSYGTPNRLLAFVLTTGTTSRGSGVNVALEDAGVANSTVITGTVTGGSSIAASDRILAAGIYSGSFDTNGPTNVTVSSVDNATYTGRLARTVTLANQTGYTVLVNVGSASSAPTGLALAPGAVLNRPFSGTNIVSSTSPNLSSVVLGTSSNQNVTVSSGNGASNAGTLSLKVADGLTGVLEFTGSKTLTIHDGLTVNGGNDGTLAFGASGKTLAVSETCTIDQNLSIASDVTFASVTVSSDETLKKNIGRIRNGLGVINRIEPVEWDWEANDKHSSGVLAQQLESVMPHLVQTAGHKSVNYNGLHGYLISAVQELSQRLDDLGVLRIRNGKSQNGQRGRGGRVELDPRGEHADEHGDDCGHGHGTNARYNLRRRARE